MRDKKEFSQRGPKSPTVTEDSYKNENLRITGSFEKKQEIQAERMRGPQRLHCGFTDDLFCGIPRDEPGSY
ncbi:MAG: hypothetical protein Q8P84_03860 [Deltaproteobacteria bacterium]|nr:hypothetical protein [Deltaproteobacteria bacterium]